MGIISIEKANHLFWLGRYTERVFTTLQQFFEYFDYMIDLRGDAYQEYCTSMGIVDCYGSGEAFRKRYLSDAQDSNSVLSNLLRAYDNGVVMRDEISSTTLAYLQLAVDELKGYQQESNPLYCLQTIIDDLYAFWGSADDCVEDEECRNIIKCGKYVERLDLYMRLRKPYEAIEKEFCKLQNRMQRVRISVDQQAFQALMDIMNMREEWETNRIVALDCVGRLFFV